MSLRAYHAKLSEERTKEASNKKSAWYANLSPEEKKSWATKNLLGKENTWHAWSQLPEDQQIDQLCDMISKKQTSMLNMFNTTPKPQQIEVFKFLPLEGRRLLKTPMTKKDMEAVFKARKRKDDPATDDRTKILRSRYKSLQSDLKSWGSKIVQGRKTPAERSLAAQKAWQTSKSTIEKGARFRRGREIDREADLAPMDFWAETNWNR